jgi:hypothetical protein
MTQPLEKPTEVEFLNPVAGFRQAKDGNFYWVKFQIDRDLWEIFEAPKPGMRIRGVVWEVEEAKKPKKTKGAFGKFWQSLFKAGFTSHPGVQAIIELVRQKQELDGDDKAVLYKIFDTDSLTNISPERLIEYLNDMGDTQPHGLGAAFLMIEQAKKH